MTAQNKNARKVAKRKEVTAAHARGEKLSNPPSAHGKDSKKRWFMRGLTAAGASALGSSKK